MMVAAISPFPPTTAATFATTTSLPLLPRPLLTGRVCNAAEEAHSSIAVCVWATHQCCQCPKSLQCGLSTWERHPKVAFWQTQEPQVIFCHSKLPSQSSAGPRRQTGTLFPLLGHRFGSDIIHLGFFLP